MIKLNKKYYLANFRQPIYIYLLLEICFKNVLHRVNALYVLIWSFKMSFKFSIIIATAWESFLLKQPQRAHEEREGLHLHSLNVSKHESVRRKNENGSVLQYRVRGIDSSSKCHASYMPCGDSHAFPLTGNETSSHKYYLIQLVLRTVRLKINKYFCEPIFQNTLKLHSVYHK